MSQIDQPTVNELFRGMTEIKLEMKEQASVRVLHHEENVKRLGDIDTKIALANGRTGTNEKAIALLGEKFAEYCEKTDARIDFFNRWFWIGEGIILVAITFGALFINLYFNARFDEKFDEKLPTAIDAALKNYDIIEINNN